MNFIDGHCDVLSKMLMDPGIDFLDDSRLVVTLPRLRQAHALLQTFAVYLPESLDPPRFKHLLESIDLFHRNILIHPEMRWVRTRGEFRRSAAEGKIGALLSLEGVDGLEGDPLLLRILYHLGVRMVGLTWNYANWAADGVGEPRAGGLTRRGKKLVKECEEMGIILDVSHLSEKGFWELTDICAQPFIASHSNVYEICAHPRNLKDDQIRAIVDRGGRIGMTFVPWFIDSGGKGTPSQLLLHMDRVCSLGGAGHIVLGSDFDGFDPPLLGLEHPGRMEDFADLLCRYYKPEEAENFMYRNWRSFLDDHLPDDL